MKKMTSGQKFEAYYCQLLVEFPTSMKFADRRLLQLVYEKGRGDALREEINHIKNKKNDSTVSKH